MTIMSVEVRQDKTVKIKLVDTVYVDAALVIDPLTITVYTPATVGAVHVTILVVISKVINSVL